jgi:two-component system, LytTR family, response regulator
MNCYVIDDETASINVMLNYIEKVSYLSLKGFSTNPLDLLNALDTYSLDFVFMDIQMPEITGIELIKAIKGRAKIIIVSAFSQYALEGFELDVVDYLLKPVPFPRFLKAVEKMKQVHETNKIETKNNYAPMNQVVAQDINDDYIFIKGDGKGKLIKIDLSEIDYFEGMRNYVAIHQGSKKIISSINMRDLEDKLPHSKFMRVHKSFIVAMTKIESVDGNTIRLKNNQREDILIGNSYREAFFKQLNSKMIE